MTVPAVPLTATLKEVGTLLRAAHDPWWIIGSAAVVLHGANQNCIADVDVLLSVGDAKRVLPTIGIALQRGSKHSDFRSSIFGTWLATPLPVEFMADFYRRVGTDWLPVQPTTREPIELEGVVVFVPSRAELVRLLEDFGRPKDVERARRLAALR